MAMEHFEEHVQPSLTTSTSTSLSGSYFMTIHPSLFRASTTTPTASPSRDFDSCEWRKNVMDKLAQQDKQIRKQSSEILALKSCIRQLVLVCTQLVVPGSEKEVADILTDVLNTVSMHGNTTPSTHNEVPSTSSCPSLEVGSTQRGRKRSCGGHSQEYGARKKPRSENPPDDNRRERLV
ncbi:hypothetical protein Aduo_009105 [Ancylostoma duodenale]